MIKSMTGYGRAFLQNKNRRIVVEIKSVNSRYSELNISLPKTLNSLEERLKSILKASVFRGKLSIDVYFECFSYDLNIKYNEAAANVYKDILSAISKQYALNKVDDSTILHLLATFSPVISQSYEPTDSELSNIWQDLQNVTVSAVSQLIAMREKEGAALKSDILNKHSQIQRLINNLEIYIPKTIEDYTKKLRKRIQDAIKDIAIDEARLLNEVAFFADKTTIDEEVLRLKSHLELLLSVLSEGSQIGRKLDFLMQEINREVNTIGSKANNIYITKIVLEIKSIVETIREQVQNIE